MHTSQETIVEQVRDRAALRGPEEAKRVLRATLGVLGGYLAPADVRWLAGELPQDVGRLLGSGAGGPDEDVDTFYARVATREGVERAFAVEHAQVVCQVLAEQLSAPARQRLAGRLPASVATLLEPRASAPSEPHAPRRHLAERARDLARGRPGSAQPLSEGQADRAQQGSVASDNPHGDTKLSSNRGLSAERDLAEGRPGSERPLGSTGD